MGGSNDLDEAAIDRRSDIVSDTGDQEFDQAVSLTNRLADVDEPRADSHRSGGTEIGGDDVDYFVHTDSLPSTAAISPA